MKLGISEYKQNRIWTQKMLYKYQKWVVSKNATPPPGEKNQQNVDK